MDTNCNNKLGLHNKIYLVFYNETGEILKQGPRELVASPSLEVFRTSLDMDLSNLIEGDLSLSKELDQMASKGTF